MSAESHLRRANATPDTVIVKTVAVVINPADAKMLDYSPAAGAILGYDSAGTVIALGADTLAAGRLAVSDPVAGMVLTTQLGPSALFNPE
ncbi:hypothetical protein Asppvi_008336 [Aspergillus pseudoviridinutans]|uniref:Alcohol dehydrogenase-like N-terminal domain-containing protein n=1 Tax=Aspergillus pseudoviridinutans TaxID=1517512 RepID=A0A9P3EV78_9EURO|nr:uncharacterized protein Asppvi_008336 [Aspergillus pseudoviridinutans]GIJ89396.1 hypothetical protein Asppvi_008336 [Aspergillus pseudoviridinutans]